MLTAALRFLGSSSPSRFLFGLCLLATLQSLECCWATEWIEADTSFVKTPEDLPLHYRVLPARLPVDRKLTIQFMSWFRRSLRVEKMRVVLGVLLDDLRGEHVLSANDLRSRLEKLGKGFEVFSRLSSESCPALERVLFLIQACSAPGVVEFGRRFEGEDDRVDFQDPVVLLKRQNQRLREALRVLGLPSGGGERDVQASELPASGARNTVEHKRRVLAGNRPSLTATTDAGLELGQPEALDDGEAIRIDDGAGFLEERHKADSFKKGGAGAIVKERTGVGLLREGVGDEMSSEGAGDEVHRDVVEHGVLSQGGKEDMHKEGGEDEIHKEGTEDVILKEALEEVTTREELGDDLSKEGIEDVGSKDRLEEVISREEEVGDDIAGERVEHDINKEGTEGVIPKEEVGDALFNEDAGDGTLTDSAMVHIVSGAPHQSADFGSEARERDSRLPSTAGNHQGFLAVAEGEQSAVKTRNLRDPKELRDFLRREMEEFRLIFAALASELAKYLRGCDAAQITSFKLFVWGKLKQVLRRLLQLHAASPQQHFRVRLNLRMIGSRLDLLQGVDDGFLMATGELSRLKQGSARRHRTTVERGYQRGTGASGKGVRAAMRHGQSESWMNPELQLQGIFRGSRVVIDDKNNSETGQQGLSQRGKAART